MKREASWACPEVRHNLKCMKTNKLVLKDSELKDENNYKFKRGKMNKLVCFEGIDGSGKSTICKKLKNNLQKAGQRVLMLHQPGVTKLGKSIRKLLLNNDSEIDFVTERLLFSAENADFINYLKKIRNNYDIILLDRSTFISEQVYTKALKNTDILRVQQHLSEIIPGFEDFVKQTYLVIVTVSRSEWKKRCKMLDGDRIEQRGNDYLERVFKIYQERDFNWKHFNKLIEVNNDNLNNVLAQIRNKIFKKEFVKNG